MSRRPKLVTVQTLVATGLRDELRSAARIRRQTLSRLLRDILGEWYQRSKQHKELKEYGSEKTSQEN